MLIRRKPTRGFRRISRCAGTAHSNGGSRMVPEDCRLLLIQMDAVVEVCRCDEGAMTCFNHGENCRRPERSYAAVRRMSDDGDDDWRGRSPRKSAAPLADFRTDLQKPARRFVPFRCPAAGWCLTAAVTSDTHCSRDCSASRRGERHRNGTEVGTQQAGPERSAAVRSGMTGRLTASGAGLSACVSRCSLRGCE